VVVVGGEEEAFITLHRALRDTILPWIDFSAPTVLGVDGVDGVVDVSVIVRPPDLTSSGTRKCLKSVGVASANQSAMGNAPTKRGRLLTPFREIDGE